MHRSLAAAAVLAVAAGAAHAQEAMYTAAATMPSPGAFLIRQQIHFEKFGADVDEGIAETEKWEAMTGLQIGLAEALSVMLELPLAYEDRKSSGGEWDADKGVEDLHATFKYRIYMKNPGGVDTTRIALMAGAAFASGDDDDFSSQTVNPHFGAVYTQVFGRHGINVDLWYRWNNGDDEGNLGGEGKYDAILHGTAWVYRISPATLAEFTDGAWYTTCEFNGIYETNGDYELRFSPGIMYEGRRFGAEAMIQLPVYDDLDDRGELDFAVGFGIRYLF